MPILAANFQAMGSMAWQKKMEGSGEIGYKIMYTIWGNNDSSSVVVSDDTTCGYNDLIALLHYSWLHKK